jgi:outer membrane protein OmpA-like peptidoglycan-associated protein
MISGFTRLQRTNPSSPAAAEAAAQSNADRQQRGQELQASSRSGFSEPDGAARETPGGEPLNRTLQAEMEARFGRDFSNVRVHKDSKEAEAMGARAFAHGRDIAFAPGESPDTDRSLLAHELTHSVQQRDAGEALVQQEPRKGANRIGDAPPLETFTRADKAAPEDDAVLFTLNEATLSASAEAALKKVAATVKSAVIVEIHGYASSEGEPEYNVNLSAHRAVAVKAELERLLPRGSTVRIVAHGETREFGASENNRRAGFKLLPQPASPQTRPAGQQTPANPAGDTPGRSAQLDPDYSHVRLFPPLTLDPSPLIPPAAAYVPQLGLTKPIDWLAQRNKWAIYGLKLDARTAGDVESYAMMQRTISINFWTSLGVHPFDAAKLADALQPIALGVATSAYLSNNYPNLWDRMDRDIKAAYPDAWSTPQVPLTDVIDFVYRKASGNDKKSLFEF